MKKLRLLYTLLIAVLVNQWAFSQTFTPTTCSTGVGSNLYGPMNSVATANSKNRTAFIIPASQLTAIGGGTITSTYFRRFATSGSMTAGNQTFSIYLQNTTAADFGSSNLAWATAIAGATQVYTGDPASAVGSTAGFKQFTQTANFVYTAGSNLAVYVEYAQTAAQASAITWDYEYGSPCISTANSNTTKYTNTTGTLGDLASSNYRRPVIAFDVTVPPATTAPACTTVTAPANAATGQSLTPTITWSAAAGQPTGYYLNIGTTAGGNDVINNQDVGNVTSYTLPASSALAFNTTYYITVVPYNAIGAAAGCTSSSFTTRGLTCPTVTAPAASATGVSLTPTFTWTAVSGVTGYKLSIGTTAGGTDVLNNQDLGNVTTYTLTTPLNTSTKYYYTLTSYSATASSTGCTERNFTTVCGPTSVPYTENFEGVTTPALPGCSSIQNAGSGNNWTTSSPASGSFNTKVLNYSYNAANAANAWWFTQGLMLAPNTSYQLKFIYGNSSATYPEKLKVAYGTSAQATAMTTVLADYPNIVNGTAAISVTLNFTTPASANSTDVYYIGFNAYSAADMNQLYVDNIDVRLSPTCIEPTAITVNGITTTGATVNWTAPATSPAGGYDVYYSTTNTAPTATTVPNQTGVMGTSATISGLTASTPYYVWVRSHCSATDTSIWSSSTTFTTACTATDITLANPYTENFESVTVPALPTCTTSVATTGNVWKTVSNPGYGFTSKTLEYPYASSAANSWFFTKGMNLVAGTTYYISYRYGNNTTTYKENLKVAIGTSADAAGMTTVINDHPNIQTAMANNVTDVVFTPTTSGVYYLGFQAYSIANQYYLFVDDIKVAMNQSLATAEVAATKNAEAVYPNPFTEFVDISEVKGATSAIVVDATGRTVASFAKVEKRLDLSHLASGMYILSISKKDGTSSSFKILKK